MQYQWFVFWSGLFDWLIFSGSFFELGAADIIKVTTISHWRTDTLCTIGRFNEQPMVTL